MLKRVGLFRGASCSFEELTYDVLLRKRKIGYLVVNCHEPHLRQCYVHSVLLEPEWLHKGLGERVYREMARRARAMGCVLYSSTDRSQLSERLWLKLCRKGLAERVELPMPGDKSLTVFRFRS